MQLQQIMGKDAGRRNCERVREEKNLSFIKRTKIVSEYLETLEKLFSPELFIVGGGVSKKADKFLPCLTAKTNVLIQAAKIQNNSGIIRRRLPRPPPINATARIK